MFRPNWILVLGTIVTCCGQNAARADSPEGLLDISEQGSKWNAPYSQGGTVNFLDVEVGAQVIHYRTDKPFAWPLEVHYDVLHAAPVLLTSRLGTEYWRVVDFKNQTMGAWYSDEKIDLSKPGRHSTRATRAWLGSGYGPTPDYGLAGFRGHYYFLVDQPNRKWLGVVSPPPLFDGRKLAQTLTFTLANLTSYKLLDSEIQSSWQPSSKFRVRFLVQDADGRRLPIVNVPCKASHGDWQATLRTQFTGLVEPTGWMEGTLPATVPDRIEIDGTVTLQQPESIKQLHVATTFRQGTGLVTPDQLRTATRRYTLPRNAGGTLRETRAIWIGSTEDYSTPADVDRMIDACRKARLNMIVPDIFVRNMFAPRSAMMPTCERFRSGFDPLAYMIKKAHAAGIEVHPWFCVTYRDAAFRKWFLAKQQTDVTIIDKNGKPEALGADVHRPAYRRFVSDLMISVARDYDVDGIHLDYIRCMHDCYCDSCRAEFAKQFGKPITAATEEDRIQWHRSAIGDIVQRTAEGVRKARPHAILSAAVFSSMRSGAIQGQDPAGWARQGWIDVVIPMDYQMQSLQVRANERMFLKALDKDDQLVTGLSLYMRSGKKVLSRPPELLCEQVELVRRMGVHGYCLFAYGHLSDKQLKALREVLNTEPAVPYFR